MFKRFLKSDGMRRILCWLGARYISLVRYTGRWTLLGTENVGPYWDEGKPFIAAFWHGRILMMPYSWRRGVPINMLISQHRDGLIIARTVSYFGIDTVAGSTSKGGATALRAMLKFLRAGQCVGITPDGPRGPRQRATDGVVQVARMSGVPVIPCTFSAKRHKLLGSWDRFMVALPFSRGVFIWGKPIEVPYKLTDEEIEVFRRRIEDGMNEIITQADRLMGNEPVEPAPCS